MCHGLFVVVKSYSIVFSALFGGMQLVVDVGIDHGHCREIDDVAHGGIDAGEVDGTVQANLDGADGLGGASLGQHLIDGIGRTQVGEDEGVHVLALECVEGE